MKRTMTLFLLWISISGCPKGIPNRRISADEPIRYFPLQVGYIWNYLYTSYQDNSTAVIKIEVLARENDEYRISSNGIIFYYIKDREGIMKKSARYYILKMPLAKGASWLFESGGFSGRVTITDVLPQMKVRENTYKNCLVVEETISNQDTLLRTYYAEGVGPVLIEEYSMISGGSQPISKTELLGYSFGGMDTTE